MPHITLSPEQTQTLAAALEPVEIHDTHGRVVAVVPPAWTKEEIEEAKSRLKSDEPRYSFQEVMEYLRSLEKQ